MRVVDANVLIYAVNADSRQHSAAHTWLTRALNGADTVAFTWLALTAFVRISTHPSILPRPLAPSEAVGNAQEWVDRPGAVIIEPTRRHLSVLNGLLDAVGTGGNLVNDAHLAAIAIEHSASVVTFDADFQRFPGIGVHTPS